MSYRISGLSPAPFRHLFGLDDAVLAEQSIRRYRVDAMPGFPCRIGLEDLPVGASALLLNYEHQPAESPYRARGPIFVREGAEDVAVFANRVPEVLARRMLSVRGYDAAGYIQAAEVVDGRALEDAIARSFAREDVDYLHVHYAGRGCYAARVERG
ncbi:MAG TPA: DUF1203 domain-containing protein [Kiloniellales bacterium]|nr:DUF1203 domain-containing protein [Kiloniellales bacterium]